MVVQSLMLSPVRSGLHQCQRVPMITIEPRLQSCTACRETSPKLVALDRALGSRSGHFTRIIDVNGVEALARDRSADSSPRVRRLLPPCASLAGLSRRG